MSVIHLYGRRAQWHSFRMSLLSGVLFFLGAQDVAAASSDEGGIVGAKVHSS